MQHLLIWPEHPGLSVILLVVVGQLFLWAARRPVHAALQSLGQSLGGALRLASRWCSRVADELTRRNREVLIEAARTETEKRLEREFVRVQQGFAKQLEHYPELHQKLDQCVAKLEVDYDASAAAPPEAPGWPEAVRAVSAAPEMGDRAAQRILVEIRKTASESEKKALKEYRDATCKRHKLLHGMAPVLKDVRASSARALKIVSAALETAASVDGHMQRYEKIRAGDEQAERYLASSALTLFLISTVAVLVAVGGAFVNFQLIALPMSELVPSGSRVLGVPVSSIAALVIVLMEAAAGMFVMEALGITELFPRVARLEPAKRHIILTVALVGLFLLASIEASLAILREQIVEAELILKASLAGADATVTQPATSMIPVIGQAVLGFILPWILAMVALPLETMVHSGRHVCGRLAVFSLGAGAGLLRGLGHMCRKLGTGLGSAFDVLIALPIMIERLARRVPPAGEAPTRRLGAHRPPLTGEHGVAS